MRPERLVVVAGTGTEVGKTWVGARLLTELLARGVSVAARKPAQSFEPGEEGSTDADVLAAVTGEPAHDVCPIHRWYPVPMAPPMAADHLGAPAFTIDELAAEVTWRAGTRVGVVETAGGVRSPLASDGDDTVGLVRALEPDLVVLVADAGLGTINAVRLSAGALAGATIVVVLNRFDADDELHRGNRDWLAVHDGYDVVTTIDELADRATG